MCAAGVSSPGPSRRGRSCWPSMPTCRRGWPPRRPLRRFWTTWCRRSRGIPGCKTRCVNTARWQTGAAGPVCRPDRLCAPAIAIQPSRRCARAWRARVWTGRSAPLRARQATSSMPRLRPPCGTFRPGMVWTWTALSVVAPAPRSTRRPWRAWGRSQPILSAAAGWARHPGGSRCASTWPPSRWRPSMVPRWRCACASSSGGHTGHHRSSRIVSATWC